MPKRLEQILSEVDALPPHERERVRAHIVMRKQVGPREDHVREGRDEAFVDVVLDAICRVCEERGIDYQSASALRRTQAYRSFKEKMTGDEMRRWVRLVTKDRRIKTRAFFHLAASLLCDNLLAFRAVVNARTMMLHAHRFPAIINAAFPGYTEAGLLHWIIRAQKE